MSCFLGLSATLVIKFSCAQWCVCACESCRLCQSKCSLPSWAGKQHVEWAWREEKRLIALFDAVKLYFNFAFPFLSFLAVVTAVLKLVLFLEKKMGFNMRRGIAQVRLCEFFLNKKIVS